MIHKLQVFLILMLIPLGGVYLYAKSQNVPIREIFTPGTAIVHVGEMPITVEIADTKEKREQGLSGRKEMDVAGMLFVFDEVDRHGMWMKDMYFPIDIVWIDAALTVVGIEQNVSPNTYPKTFRAPVPVLYAIETEAGYTNTYGIGVGKKVRLPLEVGKR